MSVAAADTAAATDNDDDDDDDESDVELPTLEHGYRTVPMEWSELAEIISSGQLSRLTRHERQQRKYEVFKRKLRRTWRSLYDYMYVRHNCRCGSGTRRT